MKKHFLLLLLMTLLPLAGWATVADLLVKPSLATGLIYNGGPQQLVVGGYNLPSDYDNAEGGVLWAVTTTDNAPTSGGALDATATDAGTYYVWYKVLADGGVYQDEGAWTKLTVGGSFCRISKASLGFEPATPAPGLVYDGTAQALFTANATAADFATIEYSIKTSSEPGTWSEWTADVTAFTGTNAGSYTVKWRIANKAEIEANLTDNEDAYSGTFADVMIAGAEITAEIDGTPAFTFNGQVQTPTIIVKSGETTLTAGTDYTVTYENNVNAGTATVKIKGAGDYTGTITKTFRINPKGTNIAKLKKGKKMITVKWKKQKAKMPKARISGYQIQLATNSAFTANSVITPAKTRPNTAISAVRRPFRITQIKKKKRNICPYAPLL